jgi:chromate reductase, NAD(P)H dehydrogenase (quinone)
VNILAFAASHRPESSNKKLLLNAVSAAKAIGAHVEVMEYEQLDSPLFKDTHSLELPAVIQDFADKLKDIDGLMIASPEYNWSFPGSLKNIIDWLSVIKPSPLANKTAFLLSATPGARGGIMGLQQLKTPLEALQMHVFHKVFPLPHAHQALTADGILVNPEQHNSLTAQVNGYLAFTAALKA